jgi:3-phosphoshikimate 1-carboxyvinyltransferase
VSRPVERLRVLPVRRLCGVLDPPGDKSISHRALILGGLAEGTTVVENLNPGADCASTAACLQVLGIDLDARGDAVRIEGGGQRLHQPDRVLDCGNSGTTLRILSGPLAAQPFLSTLTGDDSLRRRPVDRVIEPLRRMGAGLTASDGDRFPPLEIRGGPLRGITHVLTVPSAQVASCVMLAGLSAEGETSVEIPGPARDHTEQMLPAFGIVPEVAPLEQGGRRVTVQGPARLRATRLRVPADFSAAAFFLAAAAALPGSEVTVRGVNLNPTRTGLLDVLAAMGAEIRIDAERTEGGEPSGDVSVRARGKLQGFDVPAAWLPRLVDEVPAWAVAAAAAEGTSRIAGAGELRVKESDRLHALADGLTRLGVRARETADGLAIDGGRIGGGLVPSHGDHRVAMAFAVLGALAEQPVTVADTGSIATSFPGFVAALAGLGATAELVTEPA